MSSAGSSQSPNSKETSLRSEVLSFFSPVGPNCESPRPNNNLPRTAIFDNAKPYTKSITLNCGSGMNHSGGNSAIKDYFCIDRSNCAADGDNIASLDRIVRQLDFGFPSKTDMSFVIGHNNRTHREDGVPLNKPETSNGLTHICPPTAAPKRSFFSNIFKRFSIQKSKTTEPAKVINAPVPVTSLDGNHVDLSGESRSRPRKFRRWWTHKIRKYKAKDDIDIPDHSLVNTRVPMRQAAETARLSQVRVSLISPDMARPCSSMEELNDRCLVESFTQECEDKLTSSREPSESPHFDRAMHSKPIPNHLPSHSSSAIAASLSPSSTGCPKQSALVRNHSVYSTDDRSKSRVHFSPFLNNSTDVLQGTNYGPSSSEFQLTQLAATRKYSNIEEFRTSSPSYVRVAVAAFGYPTYDHFSSTSTSSTPAPRPRPTQLSLPLSRTNNVGLLSSSDAPRLTTEIPLSHFVAPSVHSRKHPLSTLAVHSSAQPSSTTDSTSNLPSSHAAVGNLPNAIEQPAEEPSDSQSHKNVSSSPCPSPNEVVQSTPNRPVLRRSRTRNQTGNPDDHEHWQRSSLIMLAVTHASPRGRTAGVHDFQQHSLIFDGAVDQPSSSEYFVSDNSPNLIPKPLNGVVELPGHIPCANDGGSMLDQHSGRIDGYYFLRQVDKTEMELASLIRQAEEYLNNEAMDEEASGLLRAAIGKGNLLINDKFVQFRDLCRQNIDAKSESSPNDITTAKLTTEVKDLDGFWAMVMLQVSDMFRTFDRISTLRANRWKIDESSSFENINGHPKNGLAKKRTVPSTRVDRPKPNRSADRRVAHEKLEAMKREMRAKKATMQGNECSDFVLFA